MTPDRYAARARDFISGLHALSGAGVAEAALATMLAQVAAEASYQGRCVAMDAVESEVRSIATKYPESIADEGAETVAEAIVIGCGVACDAVRADDRDIKPALEWSREVPTVPGWYWRWTVLGVIAVQVVEFCRGRPVWQSVGVEGECMDMPEHMTVWWQPLPLPAEPGR